jgi:hypothetical protein
MEALYCVQQKDFVENLQKMENSVEVKSVLLLMTNDKTFSVDFLTPLLQSFAKPIIGGVFYEIIYKCVQKDKGVLLLPLNFELKTDIFSFDDSKLNIFENLESTYSSKLNENGGIFIFVDAFAPQKSIFIEDLFNFFGFKYSFFGAGCGSDSFVSFPCIIHNSGVYKNAAVIGYTTEQISMGVAHGWTSISEPLKVTESLNNKIQTINWEPAFDIYKEIVETHSGLLFNENNFAKIAKQYPIGLMKIDGEQVIRDPFKTEEGALFCLDNVDPGQYITIMNGDKNSLINGASDAAKTCEIGNKGKGIDSELTFCVDCFSRVNFMGNDFTKELKAIEGNKPVHGVVTFGEIANIGDSFLEIYNKTIIVAGWKSTF